MGVVCLRLCVGDGGGGKGGGGGRRREGVGVDGVRVGVGGGGGCWWWLVLLLLMMIGRLFFGEGHAIHVFFLSMHACICVPPFVYRMNIICASPHIPTDRIPYIFDRLW